MAVLVLVAFVLAVIEQIKAKGTNLLAWSVICLTIIPGLAFLRSL